MTASAAATGFLSLPPGPLHTPQRLSLNSINDRSSFPFTAAYQRRAGTSLGCLVMLWWLVQASGTFQPQLCLRPAVPRCPHAHRCQDTHGHQEQSLQNMVGDSVPAPAPRRWVAPGPASPCPAVRPPAARRRQVGSRAPMLCGAGSLTQPLCAQVLPKSGRWTTGLMGRACGQHISRTSYQGRPLS